MLHAYELEVIALFPCSPRRVLSLGIVIISAEFALHSVSLLLLFFNILLLQIVNPCRFDNARYCSCVRIVLYRICLLLTDASTVLSVYC